MTLARASRSVRWLVLLASSGLLLSVRSGVMANDCNVNGIPDEQDIASHVSQDTNGNHIPDECEGCPAGRTYTTTADFQEGELTESIDASVSGQLRLKPPLPLFPYINVACSSRGTVARIDVNTRQVVGEYPTAPSGRYKDPSRTTVDHQGNVWVANRAETGAGGAEKGSQAVDSGRGKGVASR